MLFGQGHNEREQKTIFMYFILGIVLLEMAVTVGAIVYSITNAKTEIDGVHFAFPWMGYLITVALVPVLLLMIMHLISLAFSRPIQGDSTATVNPKMQSFFDLVRGAPTIILFAGFVTLGAAIYYLDGLMAFLLKVGDQFHWIAICVVSSFSVAWIISYVVRAYMMYKTKQMEAEYAFRQEVLARTGKVILNSKYALDTEIRMLPAALPSQPLALVEVTDLTDSATPIISDSSTISSTPDLSTPSDQPDNDFETAENKSEQVDISFEKTNAPMEK